MGRQRPAHRAARAELLRGEVRPVAAVRPRIPAACKAGQASVSVSRPNFIELCNRLTAEDEKAFEHLWRHLGLSVDWSLTYATIDRRAQRVADRVPPTAPARRRARSPTLWDVDFRTAVAQAEARRSRATGAYHRIRFAKPDQTFVEIDTTRPELILPV